MRAVGRIAVLALALTLGSLAAAPSARALGPRLEGLYVPFGFNLGYSMDGDDGGLLVGTELSIARVWEHGMAPKWVGGYIDASWFSANDHVRLSAGPEVGIGVLTVDFGYVAEVNHGDWAHGFTVRALLSLAVVHFYVRAGVVPARRNYAEFGALLKYPIAVRRWRERSSPTEGTAGATESEPREDVSFPSAPPPERRSTPVEAPASER